MVELADLVKLPELTAIVGVDMVEMAWGLRLFLNDQAVMLKCE
jgi:hypothetical protein